MAIDTVSPTTSAPPARAALPALFQNSTAVPPVLIAQGAEALLYRSTYLLPNLPCALKHRPPKPYRHPLLDQRLTRHRILAEARILLKCRRDGVSVPAVYALDEHNGWLMLEWIEGEVVRIRVNECLQASKDAGTAEGVDHVQLVGLLRRLGEAVGKLHGIGIIHGDLTTSNMILQPKVQSSERHAAQQDTHLDGEVVLIDFGLASQGVQEEDRAVDLYVLERAFASTHPRAESIFGEVLLAYGKSFKGASTVLKKLEEVRLRGRKRSMLG